MTRCLHLSLSPFVCVWWRVVLRIIYFFLQFYDLQNPILFSYAGARTRAHCSTNRLQRLEHTHMSAIQTALRTENDEKAESEGNKAANR